MPVKIMRPRVFCKISNTAESGCSPNNSSNFCRHCISLEMVSLALAISCAVLVIKKLQQKGNKTQIKCG